MSVRVVLLAVLAISAQHAHAQDDEAVERRSVDVRPRTVAVVPFAISGQPEDDWIGTGIVETVTTDLNGIGGLAVLGSGLRIVASAAPLPEMAACVEGRWG